MKKRSFKPSILVVEDEIKLSQHMVKVLTKMNYLPITAAHGLEALAVVAQAPPDLILCDFLMPKMDGMALVKRLKKDPKTRLIPIIMLTAFGNLQTKIKALQAGADDLLTKPVEPLELKARVKNLIQLKSYIDELEHTETVLFALAEVVEAREPFTSHHCRRLSIYSAMLGELMGLDPLEVKSLRQGGILHDIGKIAIPDRILLKNGPLSDDEWSVMRDHPSTGERLLRSMKSLNPVLPIIRHHHERWDGKGYPDKLKGEAIPLAARILQVVDAYDALRSRRPYKPAFSKEQTTAILKEEAENGKWDPRVAEAFLEMLAGPIPFEETYLTT